MSYRSVAVSALFFLVALPCAAQVPSSPLTITKIVSDPPGANAGHQWVEIRNTGNVPVDLGGKTIRFFDTHGKNHLIKSFLGGSMIAAGGVAVIAQDPAQFQSDEPSFSGTIFKSSFSLTVSGGTIGIRDGNTILAQSAYTAAPKPAAKPSSTTARSTKKGTVTKKSYDTGITAPDAPAEAAASGAQFVPAGAPSEASAVSLLASSLWFASYLGLLAFSGFSLILLIRHA